MIRPTNVFSPDYYHLLEIWDAQQRANVDNALAVKDWPGIANNWILKTQQDLADHKTPDPAPQPPLKRVIADDGTVSQVPFDELKAPVLPTVNSVPNSHGFWFGGAPGAPVAADRTDQIILMLRAIAQKLEIPGA